MTLPNFMIIGVAKAGTTSLYRYLDQHRQVFMSPASSANELEDTSSISRGSASRTTRALSRRHPQAGGVAGPRFVDLARWNLVHLT